MTNSSRQSDDRSGRDPEVPPAVPGWVKVFGLVALVLVSAFVVLHLTGLSPSGHS
ncbi:hypothetical protein [Micromonospora thermarum]|uniref:Uncharacterized protein n=1 Tax=Micromonospora thermarum TaxID=2720024 RepID=A0ABX0ZIP7_9ACTN|nr:hypothetical protein [Micromonospora thermarum]NJP35798.1 hypothetical protein [Micromonospora thermarum]